MGKRKRDSGSRAAPKLRLPAPLAGFRASFALPSYMQAFMEREATLEEARSTGERSVETALLEFERINENVYVVDKTRLAQTETDACECKINPATGQSCERGTGCLNRELNIECTKETCPSGAKACANRAFQSHKRKQYKLDVRLADGRGLGVYAPSVPSPRSANADDDDGIWVRAGELLLEYVGEVVDDVECERRMNEEYAREKHQYLMHVRGGIIDATRIGGVGRFLNHGCDPNCVVEEWHVKGFPRMGLFSLRPIAYGEELCFNYKFQRFGSEATSCNCGSPNCTSVWAQSKDAPATADDRNVLKHRGISLKSRAEEQKRLASRKEHAYGFDPILDDYWGVQLEDKRLKRTARLYRTARSSAAIAEASVGSENDSFEDKKIRKKDLEIAVEWLHERFLEAR